MKEENKENERMVMTGRYIMTEETGKLQQGNAMAISNIHWEIHLYINKGPKCTLVSRVIQKTVRHVTAVLLHM